MATQNRLMLDILLENHSQHNSKQRQDWEGIAAEREWMTAELDQLAAACDERTERSIIRPRPKIHMMVDPVQHCGGAQELDWFLYPFQSNYNSPKHLVPLGGPDPIKYASYLLHTGSNRHNPILRETAMTERWELVSDLAVKSGPYLQDCDLGSQQMAKAYGDMDQRRVAVNTLMQKCIQLPQGLVKAYANRVKANWRQAGWNLQKHEEVLNNIGWAALPNSPKNNFGLIRPACGRFDSRD